MATVHRIVALSATGVLLAAGCAAPIPGDLEGDANLRVHVQGQIQVEGGDSIGGAYVVAGRRTGRVLGAGRIDASGALDVMVDIRGEHEGIVVAVCSVGMWRRTEDERQFMWAVDGAGHTAAAEEAEWDIGWPMGSARQLGEFALQCPEGSGKLLETRGGRSVLEVVVRTVSEELVQKGSADIGTVRFSTRRDWATISVSVVDEHGDPFTGQVMLRGLPFNPRTMGGNSYYPHFAMAQYNGRVRILATRAGVRLLRSNNDGLLILESVGGDARRGQVMLGVEGRRDLDKGGLLLQARCVMSSVDVGNVRAVLLLPNDWDLERESFVW